MIAEALSAMIPRADGSRSGPLDDYWYKPVGAGSSAGVDVRPDNAMAVATVYRCVRLLAETLGSLSFRVYERIGNDRRGRRVAEGNELDDVLYNRPNRWQSPVDWIEQIVTHICLRGNFYANKLRRAPDNTLELAPFTDPLRMTVTQTDSGYLRYAYRFPTGGPPKEYLCTQIFHCRGFTFDGITGISILDFARHSIGLSIAQQQHGAAVFKSGGVPPMWISRPAASRWEKEAKDNFRKSFKKLTTDGGVPIMDEGMELHGLEIDNENLQWLESQGFSGHEVCRFFGVPPWTVGLEEPPANLDQAILQFVKLGLRPWAVRIEAAADIQLVDDGSRFYTKFCLDEIERVSMLARFQSYNIGVQGGWLTRNECRIDEDREPLDGLDQPLEALNMQPAGGVADGNEQGGQPGQGQPVRRRKKDKAAKDAEKAAKKDNKAAQLREAFSILLDDAARRIAAAEISATEKRVDKAAGDQAKWEAFIDATFSAQAEYALRVVSPILSAWRSRGGATGTVNLAFDYGNIRDGKTAAATLARWKTDRAATIAASLKTIFFGASE